MKMLFLMAFVISVFFLALCRAEWECERLDEENRKLKALLESIKTAAFPAEQEGKQA